MNLVDPSGRRAVAGGQMFLVTGRVGRGKTMVSVLDVSPLQVLANNTVCLQCAKLKYVKLSGGRNRPGAQLDRGTPPLDGSPD